MSDVPMGLTPEEEWQWLQDNEGGKPSALAESGVTWDELDMFERGALEHFADGTEAHFGGGYPTYDRLLGMGLLEVVRFDTQSNRYLFQLTKAGRAVWMQGRKGEAVTPANPGDNMTIRQLIEAIANGATGDYSAAAVAAKALEKMDAQERDTTVIGCKRCHTEPAVAAGLCVGCCEARVAALEKRVETADKLLSPFGYAWRVWSNKDDKRQGFNNWYHQWLDENPSQSEESFQAVDEYVRTMFRDRIGLK